VFSTLRAPEGVAQNRRAREQLDFFWESVSTRTGSPRAGGHCEEAGRIGWRSWHVAWLWHNGSQGRMSKWTPILWISTAPVSAAYARPGT